MPERSRILQEAKAPGKAWGYADVKTTCAKDKAVSSSQVVNTSDLESNEWAQTPWRQLERYVFHLQKRIYRARQRGDWKVVRGLQRLLRHSRAARLLHRHCHQDLTRPMRHDKATHVEEPCAVKIASTVLKPSGGSDTFA